MGVTHGRNKVIFGSYVVVARGGARNIFERRHFKILEIYLD
jgi:hypothetical protein